MRYQYQCPNGAFFSIIFELIKGEMQYVRDLENIDIVSATLRFLYPI